MSEVVKGQLLTHVDDCHVLVIQQEGEGINFDQFIIGKIREITINIEPRKGEGPDYKVTMDPDSSITDMIAKFSEISGSPQSFISLYECYSSKKMVTRSAEYPVDPTGETKLGQMFEFCRDKPRTLFYEVLESASGSFSTTLVLNV